MLDFQVQSFFAYKLSSSYSWCLGMTRLRTIARMQRTNKMLVAVAVMFLASLLPLHLFNLSLNFFNVQVRISHN